MLSKIIFGEINGSRVFNKLKEIFGSEIGFSQNGWTSNNVHDAIVEASTGGDPLPTNHVTTQKTIASERSYIVTGRLLVDAPLIIDGRLGVF